MYSWYDLSRAEQREVLRLARRGRRHPDRKVARVAHEWAREKLGRDETAGGSVADVVFGVLLAAGASISEGIRDYRRARRIMRVSGT